MKRFALSLILSLAFLVPTMSVADVDSAQFVAGFLNPTEAGATDDFVNLVDNTVGTSDGAEDLFVVASSAIASHLQVDVDVAPSAGDTWTITLFDDGVATALSCAITGTETTCSNANGATIASGSDLTVEVDSAAGAGDPAAAAELRFSFLLVRR